MKVDEEAGMARSKTKNEAFDTLRDAVDAIGALSKKAASTDGRTLCAERAGVFLDPDAPPGWSTARGLKEARTG